MVLPSYKAFLQHKEYLIQEGRLKKSDSYGVKAALVATDLKSLWIHLGQATREMASIKKKVENFFKSAKKVKKGLPANADELFDVTR